jgi:ankyrin repeat protein
MINNIYLQSQSLSHMSLTDFCKKGDLDNVKRLVEIEEVDITTDDNIAIKWASENGHLEVVKYLVSKGADIIYPDGELLGACANGHLEVAKYLLDIGVDVKCYAMIGMVCEANQIEILKFLVKNGADVTSEGCWALISSASSGHLSITKYLVEVGSDVTTKGNRAIALAKYYGHLEVVKYLVDVGADLKAEKSYLPVSDVKILNYIKDLATIKKYIKLLNRRCKVINKDLITLMK